MRNFWFQFHKWIGLLLAVLIIPISLTGSALVWHDGLEKLLHPARFATTADAPKLHVSAYAVAAQAALSPGERIASIRFEKGEPIAVSATRPRDPNATGRPVRTLLWLDPADARVLDKAGSNEGVVHIMHVLHGSLMVPGVGRQIVGWVGVFMAISCISGIWLWWPTVGSWLRGLRWQRQPSINSNLHHVTGFWVAIPLFILSLTGAWISFPQFFGALSGASVQQGPSQADRMARMRAQPLENPAQSLDQVVARATSMAKQEGTLASVEWPTDLKAQWTLSYGKAGTVALDDATGAPELEPFTQRPETTARLMRRIHDGTGMGLFWQVVIFIGGIIPALLAITGILMWWRTRGWRGKVARRQAERTATV